jgi:hypothetical protein
MRARRRLLVLSAAIGLSLLAPSAALSHEGSVKQSALDGPIAEAGEGEGSHNMEFIANLEFPEVVEDGFYRATDLDFHTYRVSGSGKVLPPNARGRQGARLRLRGHRAQRPARGRHHRPGEPRAGGALRLPDLAVRRLRLRAGRPGAGRLLARRGGQNQPEGSACHEDNGVTDPDERGTFLIDVTDPYDPQSVSFLPMRKGTHQVTVHPSGEYVYNSAAVVVTTEPGSIEVYDIGAEATPEEPVLVDEIELLTGLDSHDMTFNEDGTRLYSAALTHSFVIDTTDPTRQRDRRPHLRPGDQHPPRRPRGHVDTVYGEREFMFIGDELAGAVGTGSARAAASTSTTSPATRAVPGQGRRVLHPRGPRHRRPRHLHRPRPRHPGGRAADLDRLVQRRRPGARLLRVRGARPPGPVLRDLPVPRRQPHPGHHEVGHFRFPDSNLWSAKVPEVEDDGSFYIYGGDITRTLDVFRFDATAPRQPDGGSWLSEREALLEAPSTTRLLEPGSSDSWKQLLSVTSLAAAGSRRPSTRLDVPAAQRGSGTSPQLMRSPARTPCSVSQPSDTSSAAR